MLNRKRKREKRGRERGREREREAVFSFKTFSKYSEEGRDAGMDKLSRAARAPRSVSSLSAVYLYMQRKRQRRIV
jgi:hypothetical protein